MERETQKGEEMRKHQELSLEQIIEQMRVDESSSDDFCLYGKEDGELALDSLYWYPIIRMSWNTMMSTQLM